MQWLKLPVVDRFHPASNKFVVGVENKATGDSKLNDNPGKKDCVINAKSFWIEARGYYGVYFFKEIKA